MTKERFKDLVFQILNENDTFIDDIEADDDQDFFLISCIDGSKFSISVHGAVTHFFAQENRMEERDKASWMESYEKKDCMAEMGWIMEENPFLFLILFVVLKLAELNIITTQTAKNYMKQVQPYARELKEEWEKGE